MAIGSISPPKPGAAEADDEHSNLLGGIPTSLYYSVPAPFTSALPGSKVRPSPHNLGALAYRYAHSPGSPGPSGGFGSPRKAPTQLSPSQRLSNTGKGQVFHSTELLVSQGAAAWDGRGQGLQATRAPAACMGLLAWHG